LLRGRERGDLESRRRIGHVDGNGRALFRGDQCVCPAVETFVDRDVVVPFVLDRARQDRQLPRGFGVLHIEDDEFPLGGDIHQTIAVGEVLADDVLVVDDRRGLADVRRHEFDPRRDLGLREANAAGVGLERIGAAVIFTGDALSHELVFRGRGAIEEGRLVDRLPVLQRRLDEHVVIGLLDVDRRRGRHRRGIVVEDCLPLRLAARSEVNREPLVVGVERVVGPLPRQIEIGEGTGDARRAVGEVVG
jgi:hypothetical protein